MMIDNFTIEYTLEKDDDLNLVSGFGAVNTFLDDELTSISIASIHFNFYNVYTFDSLNEVLWSADALSGDELYLISALSDEDIEEGGQLITLDRIIMKEEYASDKLERSILKEFLDYCGYMMFDYVAVIASKPLKLEDDEKKLLEFPQLKLYQELNFKMVGGAEKRAPVMLKNLHLID